MMGDTPLEAIALLSCGMKQHQPGRLEGLQPMRERSLGRKASGPHLVVVSVGDLAVFCVDEHPLQPRYARRRPGCRRTRDSEPSAESGAALSEGVSQVGALVHLRGAICCSVSRGKSLCSWSSTARASSLSTFAADPRWGRRKDYTLGIDDVRKSMFSSETRL